MPSDLDKLDVSDPLRAEIATWLTEPRFEEARGDLAATVASAAAGDPDALEELRDAFSGPLPIGTGGRRGRCGAGPNRMNEVVLRETARGLAAAMAQFGGNPHVVVAYDTRRDSRRFAHLVGDELARVGVQVTGLDAPRPTPQLSFILRDLGAGGGVMLSASHNPPEDNGIKLYADDGAQVVGERDRALMEAIQAAGDPGPDASTRGEVRWLEGDDLARADAGYLGFVAAQGVTQTDLGETGLSVVFTPLHGVGHTSVLPALAARGLTATPVAAQCDPDGGRFSTVASANPEVPASMDMAGALADEVGADLVLATDPDADRLGALVRDGSGALRAIDGNRLGVLMLDHVLRHAGDPAGWVLTTLVTSPLIGRLARAAGVECHEDLLVGFKHHAGVVGEAPDRPLVFGCEESHGYIRGTDVRDKDGAVAALLLAELAAEEKARGRTLLDRLREIWVREGYHCERTANIRAEGSAGRDAIARVMQQLRAEPPEGFGGLAVISVTDRAHGQRTGSATRDLAGNVLVMELRGATEGCRLVFRPSGTGRKLKVYALGHADPGPDAELDAAATAVDALVGRVLEDAEGLARRTMATGSA